MTRNGDLTMVKLCGVWCVVCGDDSCLVVVTGVVVMMVCNGVMEW